MKLRIEIDPTGPEEVIIRARALDERVTRLQETIGRQLAGDGQLALFDGEREVFAVLHELLFFETYDGRLYAHTVRECFSCRRTLRELEELLPRTFVRASKGCLINTARVASLTRSLTGVSVAAFYGCEKTVSVSRMYYHSVRDIIGETRLGPQ